MTGIMSRMRRLNALYKIRFGKGAAILPPEVTKIHMDFARDRLDGHYGPRRFWRLYLPQLKYHNPSVSMTVARTDDVEGPATMSIHFSTPEAAAATSPAVSTTTSSTTSVAPVVQTEAGPSVTTVKTIPMKNRKELEIMEALVRVTNATMVVPTAEEEAVLAQIKKQNIESMEDAVNNRKYLVKKRKEEAMLARATKGVDVA